MSRARRTAKPLPPLAQNALLLGLGVAAIYAALAPFAGARDAPMPDLLFGLTAAWVIRRPQTASLWIVLGLGLLGDVMLSRPIGLGALGLLLAAEALRANARLLHGAPFVVEWLAVAACFALMLAGMRAALLLAFAEAPAAGQLLRYLASTALAYPVLVAGLAFGLGLRAPQGGGGSRRLGRVA